MLKSFNISELLYAIFRWHTELPELLGTVAKEMSHSMATCNFGLPFPRQVHGVTDMSVTLFFDVYDMPAQKCQIDSMAIKIGIGNMCLFTQTFTLWSYTGLYAHPFIPYPEAIKCYTILDQS